MPSNPSGRGASRKLGFSTRFPSHFIRHETRPSSTRPPSLHTHTSTTHHTSLHFNSNQQHNTKWPAEKVRLPTFPSRRAAHARKDVSTDTFYTGKTGGKTGGKAGGDTTGKTQKSHSAKAGLQVRCDMRLCRDGTEARSGSSDGFARVDCVRAESAR
jgi:hypothetical protein